MLPTLRTVTNISTVRAFSATAAKFVAPLPGPAVRVKSRRILVTGANGQVGAEFVPYLRQLYGAENVIASDVRPSPPIISEGGPFMYLNVLDAEGIAKAVVDNKCDYIVHLATVLSAVGEANPQMALELTTRSAENVLNLARKLGLGVFMPSTIAVFGPTTPKDNTPDSTVMVPTTVYGISKVYAELLGNYYNRRYGVDFRSVRYPGIISTESLPGGGTTDYAVDIYHEALKTGKFSCFLKENAALPMIFMEDALRGTVELIEADNSKLSQRVYNLGAISFTPAQVYESIRKRVPGFSIAYNVEPLRQSIAESWPRSIDSSIATRDWGWQPRYDLDKMTDAMLARLRVLGVGQQKK